MIRSIRGGRWAGAVALVGCLLAAGCGGSTASVSGTVKHKGKAVTSGTVIVMGSDNVAQVGTIQADGNYTVTGVKAGTVRVGVSSPDPKMLSRGAPAGGGRVAGAGRGTINQGGENRDAKAIESMSGRWFPIPDKYAAPEESGLSTNLKAGPNTYDIDLP